ncbi:MAG: hypothetical protein ACI9S8_002853 [Chlamydiales bacterium]|jgi:hypothetical protein
MKAGSNPIGARDRPCKMNLDTTRATVRCGTSRRIAAAAAQYNLHKPEIPGLSLATLGYDPAYIMPRLCRSEKFYVSLITN